MNKLLTTLLILLVLVGCNDAGKKEIDMNTYKQISQEEAKEIIDSESDYVILDVREEDEYAEIHIKDAVLLPLGEIEDKAQDILPNKDQIILVYCRSGNRSKQASEKLVKLGYTNIYEFGGIKTWQYETE